METISRGKKSPIELVNHNKLVTICQGCDGFKLDLLMAFKYIISATEQRIGRE